MNNVCPVCEKGQTAPTTFEANYDFRGEKVVVEGLQGDVCNRCGEISIQPQQIKANQQTVSTARKAYADSHRAAAGLLSCDDIASLRAAWGISQPQAATAFGGGANAFSKYERGEVHQSEAMDLLLRVASEVSAARIWLFERAGICVSASGEWQDFDRGLPALWTGRANESLLSINDDDYEASVSWRTATVSGQHRYAS